MKAGVVSSMVVAASAKKAGLSFVDSTCDDAKVLGLDDSWYYNWNVRPDAKGLDCMDTPRTAEFAPMFWSCSEDCSQGLPEDYWSMWLKTGVKYILGFNEPDNEEEAHLNPADAAEVWVELQQRAAELNIPRLGSPATTTVGFNDYDNGGNRALTWYDEFFTACKTCKVDFLVVHMYNQNINKAKEILTKLHTRYQLPIWVKEFNNGGRWANNGKGRSVTSHLKYMDELVNWMEDQPFIERYAWMSARNSLFAVTTLIEAGTTPPKLTELGTRYKEIPMNVGK